jgi:hypothetical protein
MKKIIRIIAPAKRNRVINKSVQMFSGILIFIKDPNKLTANIITSAINNDLKNHLIKFFIAITHINIWDNAFDYSYKYLIIF